MPRGLRTGRTVAEVGEFGLLAQLLPRLPAGPGTIVGPGQDCAVIRCGTHRLLYTVDALVEGVHFEADWLSPHQLGRKSFLVNASDVAAMGGRPRFLVVSIGVPPSYRAGDLTALHAGIAAAARSCRATVVGGNLTRATQLFISIALLADAPKRIVTRQGARPGDRVYVTGTLGDAALGVRLLSANPRHEPTTLPLRRFREPSPRLRAGRLLVESGVVSAMIDVSDGLVQDLGHICIESNVGALVRSGDVPLSAAFRKACAAGDPLALHGGEDYELLCTVPERNVKRLERNRARLGCPIACVGEITVGGGVRVVDADGKPVALNVTGYDHFRGRF
ncbi:MAG: thiamine-phosphate kinase [Candidatus Binatia bacterium]